MKGMKHMKDMKKYLSLLLTLILVLSIDNYDGVHRTFNIQNFFRYRHSTPPEV